MKVIKHPCMQELSLSNQREVRVWCIQVLEPMRLLWATGRGTQSGDKALAIDLICIRIPSLQALELMNLMTLSLWRRRPSGSLDLIKEKRWPEGRILLVQAIIRLTLWTLIRPNLDSTWAINCLMSRVIWKFQALAHTIPFPKKEPKALLLILSEAG